MTKKHVPKWKQDAKGFYSLPDFTDDNFGTLAESLGITNVNQQDRTWLHSMARIYLTDKDYTSDIPKFSEVRAALEELREYSQKLSFCLENLDDLSLQSVYLNAFKMDLLSGEEIDALMERKSVIRKLHKVSEIALKNIPMDKGGRPSKGNLTQLILNLRSFFAGMTGKKATVTWNEHDSSYGGKFFNFVHAFLQIIDPEVIYSNQSLGQQIKRALILPLDSEGQNPGDLIPTIEDDII